MLEAYSQGGIAMSQHDMMSCWLKRVACSVRGGVAYVCSASSRICPATDTSQSLDMYDAAATQLLQHLPLFSQLFVTVTAMQALDAAFLAPAAPVQRSVATSRSLKRSSTRRVASKPVGNVPRLSFSFLLLRFRV